MVPELGAHVQTRAGDGEEWSEVAIVVNRAAGYVNLAFSWFT